MDSQQNFAFGVLNATGLSLTGLTATFQTGHGARFTGTPPFNVVVYDNDYANAAAAKVAGKCAIYRILDLDGDDITFKDDGGGLREAQESTTALSHNTAGKTYTVMAAVTKKTLDDIQTDLDAKVPLAQKGAANGVATLDAGGKIPQTELPPIALNSLTIVADQAGRLALATTVEIGDAAKQTDNGKTYVLYQNDGDEDGDWAVIGDAALVIGDVTDLQTTLDAKVPVISVIRHVFASFSGGTHATNYRYDALQTAINAAVSGDCVLVHSGTYDHSATSITLKDGVNLHFMPGAKIVLTNPGNFNLFIDNGVAVNCRITGNLEIEAAENTTVKNLYIINLTAASNLIADIASVKFDSTGNGSSCNIASPSGAGSKLVLHVKRYHQLGTVTVSSSFIRGSSPTSVIVAQLDHFYDSGSGTTMAFTLHLQGSTGSKAHIKLGLCEIVGTGYISMSTPAGTLIEFGIISRGAVIGGAGHIKGESLTGGVASANAVVYNVPTGGKVEIAEVINPSGTNKPVIQSVDGAPNFIMRRVVNLNDETASHGININSASTPNLYGGMAIVLTNASAESFHAVADTQIANIYGTIVTNKAKDSDVTIQVGTLVADANVV